MSQLLPPPFDHVTVRDAVDALSHMLVVWLGIALFVVICLRWYPRDPHPTLGQWFRFIAIMIPFLYASCTAFLLLPVGAYGRFTSIGLLESLRLALFPVAYFVGVFAVPQLVLWGGKKVLASVRRQR